MESVTFPPGPSQRFPGILVLKFMRDPIGMLTRVTQSYGDIAHLRFGRYHVFVINHPDYVKDVLATHHRNFVKTRGLVKIATRFLGEGILTTDGEYHDRQKRLMAPAFYHQNIVSYGRVMGDYAERAASRWRSGEILEIHEQMMRLTLAIVAKALFDADVESEAGEIIEAVTTATEHFSRINNPFTSLLEWLPLPSNRRFHQAKETIDSTVYRIIAQHRASGERGDLLSMLLRTHDVGGEMTDLQVHNEALALLMAGHATTSTALTWTWYLLSQSPESELRLHKELDEVLGGRLPTVEDIPKLRYTRMVFSETLRLYPPGWMMGRESVDDCTIGNYFIPGGSALFMSQYVMHRNPRFFPNPESFDPSRWSDGLESRLPRFAYFPFGGGSTSCLGEPFAWMEAMLVMTTIAQKWQMRLVPGHLVSPLPTVTLRPKYGIRMIVNRRETER